MKILKSVVPRGLPDMGAVTDYVSSSINVAITPGFSDVAPAWTEMFASTTEDAHWLSFSAKGFNDNGDITHGYTDIAIGAAASEVIVIPNIALGGHDGTAWALPIFIPKGSRVSVRHTSGHATEPNAPVLRSVALRGSKQGDLRSSPSALVSVGVALNNGTVLSAVDTWVELTASTAAPAQAIIAGFANDRTSWVSQTVSVDVAVGQSGSEVVAQTVITSQTTSESVGSSLWAPTPIHIPAGSRLAVRMASPLVRQAMGSALLVPYS